MNLTFVNPRFNLNALSLALCKLSRTCFCTSGVIGRSPLPAASATAKAISSLSSLSASDLVSSSPYLATNSAKSGKFVTCKPKRMKYECMSLFVFGTFSCAKNVQSSLMLLLASLKSSPCFSLLLSSKFLRIVQNAMKARQSIDQTANVSAQSLNALSKAKTTRSPSRTTKSINPRCLRSNEMSNLNRRMLPL